MTIGQLDEWGAVIKHNSELHNLSLQYKQQQDNIKKKLYQYSLDNDISLLVRTWRKRLIERDKIKV